MLLIPRAAVAMLLLVAPSPALAFDQWWDPDLEDGVRLAELIVVGTIVGNDEPHETPDGWLSHDSRMKVDRVLVGTVAVGDTITYARLNSHHGPKTPPPAGMQFLLFLRKVDGKWQMLTPSWGLLRVSAEPPPIVLLPIRDPSGEIRVRVDIVERWVRLWRDPARDPTVTAAFVKEFVNLAAATKPTTKDLPDVEAQVLALEICYAFGTPDESTPLAPFLGSPYHHVRRCASRALGTCGGEGAVAALRERLAVEDRAEVISDIAHALFRLQAADPATRAALTAKLEGLPAPEQHESRVVELRNNIMNPQLNCVPAPRWALAAALKRASGEAGTWETLTGWAGHPWRAETGPHPSGARGAREGD